MEMDRGLLAGRVFAVACCALFMMMALSGPALADDSVPRMEADELLAILDSPDVVIIDVRRAGDWVGSQAKIRNAVRKPYNAVDSWADSIPREKIVVLYCA